MKFIKDYSLQSITNKFKIIYCLILFNLMITIVATDLLISEGIYILSSSYFSTNLLLLLIEGIIPAVILYWQNLRMKQANDKQLIYSNAMINITMLIFGFIDLYFLYNLSTIS